ncbi:hypothetical protein JCM10213v2_006011 [Rhodosporidiobolus nylandii]
MAQPSPAQHGRVEDKGGEEDGDGERAPRSPLSLLDLPDELLALVLAELYESLRSASDGDRDGILVPLSYLLVSKRVCTLGRPLWFRHFTLSPDLDTQDRQLSHLLLHQDVLPLIHSLHTEHPRPFGSLHTTIVGMLANLSSLSISFACSSGEYDETEEVPAAVTSMLKQLGELRYLRLTSYPDLEDDSFSIQPNLPALRHLDTGSNSSTLSVLRLKPEETPDHSVEDPDEFVQRLGNACVDGVFPGPLRRLVLDLPSFVLPRPNAVTGFDQTHLQSILEHLQSSRFERLDLSDVFTMEWGPCFLRLQSVKIVALTGTCNLHEADHLHGLHSFLSMFPNLSTLLLEGFSFSASPPQTADAISTLDAVPLALRYASLAVLIIFLHTTAARELRFKAKGEKREMRWRRANEEEDFASDCWTLE